MSNFVKLASAGPLFFRSAWILMIFAGITHQKVGVVAFGYVTAMIVAIGLWLVVAPAIGAIARASKSAAKRS